MKRINAPPLFETLLGLCLFFLPFQDRLHRPLKHLAKITFAGIDPLLPYFNTHLDFTICDFFMIGLLFFLRKTKMIVSDLLFYSFLILALFSIFFSENAGTLWPYWRWAQLGLPLLAGIAASKHLQGKKLTFIFAIFAVGLFLESTLAIAQYFAQHSFGFKSFGEPPMRPEYSAGFGMASMQRWGLDKIFHYRTGFNIIIRAAGTFPHCNILGGYLTVAILCLYPLFFHLKKKWLVMPLIPLGVFALFLSYSRAALIATFGGSLLFFLLIAKRTVPKKWLLASLVAISALTSFFLLFDQITNRGGLVGHTEESQGSDEGRIVYQNTAMQIIKSSPMKGVGLGQSILHMRRYSPASIQTVHNIYLLLLAETGILGSLCFFLGTVFVVFHLYKSPPSVERATFLSLGFALAFLGACDHYLFTMPHGRLLLFFSLAFALTLPAPEKARQLQES